MRDALEEIYETFAAPTPPRIEGCPCCTSKRNTDVLLNKPLRQLTGEDLWRYVGSAFLTIGGEEDFRYLLPRILDISVNEPQHAEYPEIVLGKLCLANWESWTAKEQSVIEEFIDAWFERALLRDVEEADDVWIDRNSESVLCGASRAGLPIERWLVRLHAPFAAPVLADLKQRFPREMSEFWKDDPEGLRQLSTILAQGQA